MSVHVGGNTRSLPPSHLRRVERLYNRKLDSSEIVSLELAREICSVANDLRRRIGVLVSREGRVEEVFLGTKDILYLPDLGRYRLGRGRLRRLRLIFSDLSNQEGPHIPPDIYGDLEKLRLDLVAGVKAKGTSVSMAYATLVPGAEKEGVRTEIAKDMTRLDFDFERFIEDLESELETSVGHEIKKGSAFLVGVYGRSVKDWESSMAELEELCRTAGLKIAGRVIQRKEPDPKTLLGKGKLEDVVLQCLRTGSEILVFDGEIRPSQWRIITNSTELKIIDRSMLILDIFAQRATSSEGRLQVELAQLKYNLPRLVEKDAGLSRLTGGIGGRGPGETKLEIGRRRSRERITLLERKIVDLGRQRNVRRSRRLQNEVPLVSVVGYTNVGKSTLFNALTGSSVTVENKLFATLDPSQRNLSLLVNPKTGERRDIVLSDTVGFIRDLPDELVTAFKATLEELSNASLLLHVVDASDSKINDHMNAVYKILEEMDIRDIPEILVFNKIDKVDQEKLDALRTEYEGIYVSAAKREGLRELQNEIVERIAGIELKKGAAMTEAASRIS